MSFPSNPAAPAVPAVPFDIDERASVCRALSPSTGSNFSSNDWQLGRFAFETYALSSPEKGLTADINGWQVGRIASKCMT
jgi:hypothetical protein